MKKLLLNLLFIAGFLAWGGATAQDAIPQTYSFKRIAKPIGYGYIDGETSLWSTYTRWNYSVIPGVDSGMYFRVGFDLMSGGSASTLESAMILDMDNIVISNYSIDNFTYIADTLQSADGNVLSFNLGSTKDMQTSGVNLLAIENLRGSGGGFNPGGVVNTKYTDYYFKTDLAFSSTGAQRAAISNQSSGTLYFDAANTIYSNLDAGEGNGLIFSTWRRINRYISAGNIQLDSKISAPGQDVVFNFAGIGPDKVLPWAVLGGTATNTFSRMIVSSQVQLAKQDGAYAFDGTDLIIELGGVVSYLYADQLLPGTNLTFRTPADEENVAGSLSLNGSSQEFGTLSFSRTGAAPIVATLDFGENSTSQIVAFDRMTTSDSLSGTDSSFIIKNYVPDQDHIYFREKLTSQQQAMLEFDGFSGSAGAQDGGEYGWEYLPDIFDVTPASVSCKEGDTVTFTADTALTPIQWRYSADGGKTWSDISGATGVTYSFTAEKSFNNYRYRCIAGPEGKMSSVVSLYVLTPISITKQPSSVDANNGSTVSFEVVATGDDISYQWQVSYDGGASWNDISGATSSVYSVKSELAMNGYIYRCVLSSPLGTNVITSSATLTVGLAVEIISHPQDQTVMYNDTATFSCEALNVVSASWEKSVDNGATWAVASDGTAYEEAGESGIIYSYSVPTNMNMSTATVLPLYRCVLTNARGTARSQSASLKVLRNLTIVKQPETQRVSSSGTARFTVEVIGRSGTSITYYWTIIDSQGAGVWYSNIVSDEFTSTWSLNSANLPNFASYNGMTVQCQISQAGMDTVATEPVYLYVQSAPQVSVQPQTQYAEEGGNVEFSITAVGEPVLYYEWQVMRVGTTSWEAAGSITDTLTLNSVGKGMNGNMYRCKVTNTIDGKENVTYSDVAYLYVGSAIKFTKQPESQQVGLYANVSFTVEAIGEGELSYQWEYSDDSSNWTEIYGATNPTLSLSEVPFEWNGRNYRCVVSDTVEYSTAIITTSAVSNSAVLTVASTPIILEQPKNTSVVAGEMAEFSVSVSGGRLSYVWYVSKDAGTTWSEVSGSYTSTLKQFTDYSMNGWQYYCLISNGTSSIRTETATLTVSAPIVFNKQPESVTCYAGETVEFSVDATCIESNVSYQWQISYDAGITWEGVSGVGGSAQTSTLQLQTTPSMKNCYIRCIAKNYMGKEFSSNYTIIRLQDTVSIKTQPSNAFVYEGKTANFVVVASGTAPLTYQWQVSTDGGQSWANIDGATSNSYSVTASPSVSGSQYMCVVSNGGGSVYSNIVTLTVPTPFTIVSYPASSVIYTGDSAVFSISVDGDEVSYQWQKYSNGKWVDISGATEPTLTVSGDLSNDLTQYRCIVSNGVENKTTSAVSLRVYSEPEISPEAHEGIAGQSYTVSLVRSHAGETYQWEISTNNGASWSPISGATETSYTIDSITTDMDGNLFRVSALLPSGVVRTSNTAKLSVNSNIVIKTQPVASQTVPAGESATFSVIAEGENLSYQWQWLDDSTGQWFDMSVASAKTSTLVIDPVTKASNNNIYMRCLIGNGSLEVASESCIIYVEDSVFIDVQPESELVGFSQESVTLSVDARGSNLSYQWQKYDASSGQWVDLAGATSSTYTISDAEASDSGEYRCVVSNAGMSVVSGVSHLGILDSPVISSNSTSTAAGTPLELTVNSVEGASYAWEFKANGSGEWSAVGGNSPSLTITPTELSMSGDRYRCTLTLAGKSALSNEYVVSMVSAIEISEQPKNTEVIGGTSVELSVVASGATSYQWQMFDSEYGDWNDISGAVSSSYVIDEVTQEYHNSFFRCRLTSSAQDIYTDTARIYIKDYYTVSPETASVEIGGNAEFSVINAPSGASFQWESKSAGESEWVVISGATSSTYTLAGAAASDNNRTFRCYVEDSSGGAYSTYGVLTIDTGVTIVSQPVDRAVDAGETVSFTVGVSGTAKFQWQYRTSETGQWTNILPAVDATYSFSAALSQNGYEYRCSIMTASGVGIYSDIASLTVKSPATITISEQPVSVSTIERATAVFSVVASGSSELYYQWQFSTDYQNWSDISGATGAVYSIPVAHSTMAGKYRCVVSNGGSSKAISEAVSLTVNPKFSVLVNPRNTTTSQDVDTSFYTVVAAPYDQDITYTWYVNGTVVGSETTKSAYSILTISGNVIATHNGQSVVCEITCNGSTITTSPASITITEAPVFVLQPIRSYGVEGGEVTFTVGVVGKPDLFATWYQAIVEGERIPHEDYNNSRYVWTAVSENDDHVVENGNLTIKNLTAATEDTLYYSLMIRNAIGDTYSNVVYVTVTDAMEITLQPKSVTTGLDGAVSFSAASSAKEYLSVQWEVSYDGGSTWYAIPGATKGTLSVSKATSDMNGYQYRAKFSRKVYDSSGAVAFEWDENYTSVATLTVLPYPYIYEQPAPSSVIEGETVTFSVAASGGNLSYQWQVSTDGGYAWTDVEGATDSTYKVLTKFTGDSYQYRCLVVGSGGGVVSESASLAVWAGVRILSQPKSLDVVSGETASFSINAFCIQPITYQWQISTDSGITWTNLSGSGANTNQYSIVADVSMNAAYFRCVLYNGSLLAAESDPAILNVYENANVISDPSDVATTVGGKAVFTILAGGKDIKLQWQSSPDGSSWSNISGATGASYTISPVTEEMDGTYYRCRVYNSSSEAFSKTVKLSVTGDITIDPLPNVVDGYEGSTVRLEANAVNATSYQWQRFDTLTGEWTNVDGATSSTFDLTLQMKDYNMSYRCVVSNGGTIVYTNPVLIVVYAKVSINAIQSFSANVGSPASIFVDASGYAPLSYSWEVKAAGSDEWVDLPGENSPTLYFASLTYDMNGNAYRCTVSNPGSSASAETTVTVTWPPKITSDISSQTVYAGDSATFKIEAEGAQPLTYKWSKGKVGGGASVISEATGDTLVIPSVALEDNGTLYYCEVSNSDGTSISSTVRLDVKVAVTGQTLVAAGSSLTLGLSAQLSNADCQWQVAPSFDVETGEQYWIDIPGETQQTLTINPVAYDMRGNSYRCVISLANDISEIESDAFTLSVGQNYSDWAVANGIAGSETDISSNGAPSNLERYVFGDYAFNPITLKNVSTLESSGGFAVSFRRQKLAVGAEVRIQYSDNLIDWNYADDPVFVASDGDYDLYEVRIPNSGKKNFVRFEIVRK